ncbi:MAG: hypothetical protein K0S74_1773 [Chlamydiales bacterium]|jgi:hypothetical protein|nr:hypothetical protein [Chlamydiales bacterium]
MGRFILAIKAFFKILANPDLYENLEPTNSCCMSSCSSQPMSQPEEKEHLRLLSLLQQQGRLIDFLKEDLTGCSDAQIGAAAREVHAACRDKLEEIVTIRPLFIEEEGSSITIPAGYDASYIKLVGNVKGEAPYKGTLRHAGWKAHKLSLPKQTGQYKREVLTPAEIEVT